MKGNSVGRAFMRGAVGAAVVWSFFAAARAADDDGPKPIESEAVSIGRPIDFSHDIRPILEANCTACHNAGIREGELSLEEVADLLRGGDRGAAVVPGKPEESLLLAVAAHRREPVMPPPENDVEAKNLTPRELGLIRQWILEGAAKSGGMTGPMIAWRRWPAGRRAVHAVALSPHARLAAIGRGNQVELYDVVLGEPVGRLVDPALSEISDEHGLLYPGGAADRDEISTVAFSPDGTVVAAGGYRAVKLWRRRAPAGAESPDFKNATAVAVSADGARMAVAIGPEVRLVNIADRVTMSSWPLPAEIRRLALSADGSTVAAVADDTALHVWNVSSGQPDAPRPLLSPTTALAFVRDKIVTAHEDGAVRIWGTGAAPERELSAHIGPVRAVAAIHNDSNLVLSGGDDGKVRIWDVTADAPPLTISHGSPVTAVAAAPDGKTAISCGADGSVGFWGLDDGKKRAQYAGSIARSREDRKAAESRLWLAMLSKVAEDRLKETEAGAKDREEIRRKAGEALSAAAAALTKARKNAETASTDARSTRERSAASPDDADLKSASEQAAKRSEAAASAVADAEETLRTAERSVGLADEALASVRRDVEARSQETKRAAEAADAAQAEGAVTEPPARATAAAFTRDGRRLIVGYSDGTAQSFSALGEPLDPLASPDGAVTSVWPLGPDEALLRSENGAVRRIGVAWRWDFEGSLGPPPDAPSDLGRSAFADRVLALAVSPDGTRLAVGGGVPSRGGELSVWNVETRTPVLSLTDAHSDTVQAVTFSRDGKTLASGGADKFAKLFDADTGRLLRSLEGHTDQVLGVSLKADGTAAATVSADATVKLWNAATGEQRHTLSVHPKQVTGVRYVGLSEEFVTGSGDRTVRLFRDSDGRQTKSFDGPADYVHALDVSADGATIIAGGEDGFAYVWDAKTGQLRQRIAPPSPSAGPPER